MSQFHHLPVELPQQYGRRSRAYWAVAHASRAVIFVHGFNGDPVSTWPRFPALLTTTKDSADCDIVFFGYDGLRAQSNTSAGLLAGFLSRYLRGPGHLLAQTRPGTARRANFAYERIVVVAHSLGAVVTRLALLQLHAAPKPPQWLSRVRLVFMAPAHNGAYAALLAGLVLSGKALSLPGLVASLVKYQYPLLQELEPGSVILKDLHARTKQALKKVPAPGDGGDYLRAHRVVWAENELVVLNKQFLEDLQPTVNAIGKSHTAVCKPDTRADTSFATLLDALA